jgi:hypothetical protein
MVELVRALREAHPELAAQPLPRNREDIPYAEVREESTNNTFAVSNSFAAIPIP